MKRFIILLLLLMGMAFPEHKQVIVTKIQDNETIKDVDVSIQDEMLTVLVNIDGEEKTFEANLNDEKALEAMRDMLAEMNVDIDIFSREDENQSPAWSQKPQGFLGVQLNDLTPQLRKYFKVKGDDGVLVAEVVPDSPAEAAGLEAGDIILSVNDEPIRDARSLSRIIRQSQPEAQVTLTYLRKGKKKSREVTLGETERPAYAFMTGKHGMPMMEDFPFRWNMFPFNDDDDSFYSPERDDLREEVEQLKKELEVLREEMEALKQ